MLVGAYPSLPEHARRDAVAFDAFHERIALVTGCSGFEIPFGSAFVPDEAELLRLLRRGGTHVLTLLPAVLERGVGLADPVEEPRGAAVALVRRAVAAAVSVNESERRAVVDAVLLHSAPRVTRATADAARAAFSRSLAEIAGWDAHGVRFVIEHCDSFEGPGPAKGFLDLPTELDLASRHGFGTAINWGRSYLETRRLDGPLEHARAARDAGTLAMLGVSGVSDTATPLGPAFSDSHASVRTDDTVPSLLDPDTLQRFLEVDPGARVVTKVAGGPHALAASAHAARRPFLPAEQPRRLPLPAEQPRRPPLPAEQPRRPHMLVE
ncbi:uncharacterized protein DUF4862 [Rathayibacter sp. PhB93]|uniref:DUF4862 family protein n=1 Tax=unclassified Rathayibacter TaxID=2609250 RepID=UPI000F49328F|nr:MULTISPECIES: DUF4862 family protein [unclassified Rathayibacter]ROQ03702.1 uncharacterized protein DUF4862 [Rathayibacter sp. PhB93]TDQ10726.1 uncharacterized protein DUF4862 [Rathayibacter sp. PhB1]